MSSELQNKLYHYEPLPPDSIWNGINEALDESAPVLAQKLHDFQQAPPAGSWNRILREMDGKERKAVPAYRRLLQPAALAAAAAVLVIFLVSVFPFGSDPSGEANTAGTATPALPPSAPDNGQPQPETESAPPLSGQTIVSAPPRRQQEVRYAASRPANRPLPSSVIEGAIAFAPDEVDEFMPEFATPRHVIDYYPVSPDRYLVYSDGNGKAMKFSKKLYDLIACADHDQPCKENLQRLQKRVASNDALSTDFTGMLEMLRSLKENQ